MVIDVKMDEDFRDLVKTLIGEGKFDDAVLDRMQTDNRLIDRYCADCEKVCKENFRCNP
jgi:hypothetical protein